MDDCSDENKLLLNVVKLLKERDDVLPIVENYTRLSHKTPPPCKRKYNRGFCPEIIRFDHEKALLAGKRRTKKGIAF